MKHYFSILVAILLLFSLFFSCKTLNSRDLGPDLALLEAEKLSAAAWEKLWQNDFAGAQEVFGKALDFKPGYLDATRGLGLANYIRAQEFTGAQQLLDVAMKQPADPLSVAILQFLEEEIPFRKGFKEQLQKHYQALAKNKQLPFWIRRFATDKLVSYALNFSQDLKTVQSLADQMGNVQDWRILGPFSNVSHSAMLHPVDTESKTVTPYAMVKSVSSSKIAGKNNEQIANLEVAKSYWSKDGWVNLSHYLDFPRESAVFASHDIILNKDEQWLFLISRRGALRVWIDDVLVLEDPRYKSGTDLHWLKVPLKKGTHSLVLQLANQYDSLAFRVSMFKLGEGGSVDNLSGLSTPEGFGDFSPALAQDPLFNSLADTLVRRPDQAETYFWLAWLANQREDGTSGLDLVLAARKRLAAGKGGEALLFQYEQAISFLNENNYIDARNLLIKIAEAEDIFAPAADFVIKDYISHHHPRKAEALMEKVKKANNNWFYALESELLLLLEAEDQEAVIKKLDALIIRFNSAYPDAPGLFSTFLSKATDPRQGYGAASDFYSRLRAMGRPLQADLGELTQAFFQRNYSHAANLATRVLRYQPYNSGALEDLIIAKSYQTGGQEAVIKLADKLLNSYPRNEVILDWRMDYRDGLIEYLKFLSESRDRRINKEAVNEMLEDEKRELKSLQRRALNLEPGNFSLRKELRQAESGKSFTPLLTFPALDEVITEFEAKEQTWSGDAVVVYDGATELFLGQGASYRQCFYILKILSENGVIEESTQSLSFNPQYADMEIQQAFLLKPDGSTIDADRRGNLLSFQGLQTGDYVVYQYTVNQYEPGELNTEYWVNFRFNSFYAVSHSYFRLLYPADKKLNIARHFPERVEITDEETAFDSDYKLYTFYAKNLAPVAIESHLPNSLDLFAWVDISTLQDWQPIIDWYENIYLGQSLVTYKIAAKVAELTEGLSDREAKLKAIFDFVSQKIKYEDLNFQYSAYKPQRAESVLADGFGDCKDKATLLISMLKAAGIPSHIALNTPTFTGNNFFLPSPRFNHTIVIVPGEEGEADLILDPTSEYLTYPDLPSGSIGSPYLPITSASPGLVRIPEPAARGKTLLLTGLKKDGQTDYIDGSILYNNDRAGELRAMLFTDDAGIKDMIFSTLFNYAVPGFHLDNVEYTNLYTLKQDPQVAFKASIPEPIRSYNNRLAVLELPWMIGLPSELRPALSELERKTPFTFKYERYANPLSQTIYYTIPENYKVLSIPSDLVYYFPEEGYIKYTFELKGRQLVATRDFYLPFMEIAPDQLALIKETFLLSIQKEEEKIILSE